MLQIVLQILFGWPSIILALLLAVAGVILKRPRFLVAGAILFTPPALYLTGYPALRWVGLLLPLFLLGASFALKQGKPGIAWALLSPPLLLSAWLAFVVVTQIRNLSGG